MFRIVACLLALSTLTARAEEAARPVRVQTVEFTPEQAPVTYPGTVQARVQASLGFRVGGKVTDRWVDIGDRVTPGQKLARLDWTDAGLTLDSAGHAVRAAEAEAVNARAEFQRYKGLGRNSPAFLPSEFDKRQAALDGAEARLAQAQRQYILARDQLEYTTLQADAAGVITDLKLEVGQVVAAGQTVFTLAHTAETEIVVNIPENRLPDIKAAQAIQIRLWSRPDAVMAGRVREIGALADPVSRTFAVKVAILDQTTDAPGLGMTAAVTFDRPTGKMIARLPASAVVSVNGVPSVWTLDPIKHRASAQPVEVSAWQGDGQIAIVSGIKPGDQVVTAGASGVDATMPLVAWAGASR
jgi:RND family efflux transporter MFP subunit